MKFDAGAFVCESPDLTHNISRSDIKYADMQYSHADIKTLQRTAPKPTAICPCAATEDALHDLLTMTTCTRKN